MMNKCILQPLSLWIKGVLESFFGFIRKLWVEMSFNPEEQEIYSSSPKQLNMSTAYTGGGYAAYTNKERKNKKVSSHHIKAVFFCNSSKIYLDRTKQKQIQSTVLKTDCCLRGVLLIIQRNNCFGELQSALGNHLHTVLCFPLVTRKN